MPGSAQQVERGVSKGREDVRRIFRKPSVTSVFSASPLCTLPEGEAVGMRHQEKASARCV